MGAWLVVLALNAPAWPAGVTAKPAVKELALSGEATPAGLAHIPAKRKLTLTVEGPVRLQLTFVGLREKRGKKLLPAGKVQVRLDGKKTPVTRLTVAPASGWTVAKKPRWVPTQPTSTLLDIPAGRHRVLIAPRPDARLGVGFAVARVEETAPPEPAAEPSTPPPEVAAGPDAGATEPAAEVGAPPAPLVEEPGVEPDLAAGVERNPEPDLLASKGFILAAPVPPTTAIEGPHGTETFSRVNIDSGLTLDALGPGVINLDIHAHRDPARPETEKPVIVGIMLDEVLLQTLAVDQGPSSSYRVEDADYVPSERVTLRVPIPPGSHRVRLTLSDSAIAGASIRVSFSPLEATEEPTLLTAEVARSSDLTAVAPLPEVYGTAAVGVIGAAFLPAGLGHLGVLAELDLDLAVPVAGPRLSIGLSGAWARVEEAQSFADPRTATGRAHATLTWMAIPVLAEARWSAPLASPFGLEVGLGGGAVIGMGELRANRTRSQSPVTVSPAGAVQLTLMLELGPGAVVLRGRYVAALPHSSRVLSELDPGGGSAGLGYRFIFGGR